MKKEKNKGNGAHASRNSRWSLVLIIATLPIIFWRYGGAVWNKFSDDPQGAGDKSSSSTAATMERRKDVYKLRREVSQWEKSLFKGPTDNVLAEIMSISLNLAESSGIKIKEKRMHLRMTAPPGWERVGITVTGEGNFQELVEFLKEISFHEKYISVDRLQIHPQVRKRLGEESFDQEQSLSFQVTICTLTAKTVKK